LAEYRKIAAELAKRFIGIGYRSVQRAMVSAYVLFSLSSSPAVAEANETAAAVRKLGRRAELYCASVEDDDACAAVVNAAARDFGSLSILVNNAGIASRGNSVASTDPAEMRRVVAVHAIAPFVLSKAALPHLRAAGRGDIIMISSVATQLMSANGAPYSMGKAAQEALARTIAKEERKHGVRCNIVAPSLTDTDMGRKLSKARGTANIRDLDANSPFGRVSTPEDVAAAVVWLVSDGNPYANGQKINIDGGNY